MKLEIVLYCYQNPTVISYNQENNASPIPQEPYLKALKNQTNALYLDTNQCNLYSYFDHNSP